MKNTNIKIQLSAVFLLISFAANSQIISRNQGMPYILNFTTGDYDAHEQNFDVIQGNDGKMYFANFSGILEYDGTNWNKIPMYSGMRVLSLDKNNEGKIFAAGLYDFGYLKQNSRGVTTFLSLAKNFERSDIGKIHTVLCADSITYFLSEEKLFIAENDSVSFIPLKNKAQAAFLINKKLYVFFEPNKKRKEQVGLAQFSKDKFITLKKSFDEDILDVKKMIDFPQANGIAIVSSTQGFFIYKDNIISRLPIELDNYMAKHSISDIELLSHNTYAIATNSGGLILANDKGEIFQVIDKHANLQSESINSVFLDEKSAIWLATNDGISKVEFSFPVTYINNFNSGLEGKVLDIVEYNEHIFVATNKGLFYLNGSEFTKINGLNFACWDLLKINDVLVIASSTGIYILTEELDLKKTPINKFTYCLMKSETTDDIIYSGMSDEVYVLSINGSNIVTEKSYANINGDVTKILETENADLFFETSPNNIYFYSDETEQIKKLNFDESVISLNLNVKGQQIFFSSEKGLYTLNSETAEINKFNLFQSDTSSYHLWINDLFIMSNNECILTDGDKKNLNICTEDTLVAKKNRDKYKTVFKPISEFAVEAIFKDPKTGKLWLGGKEGIVIIDNQMEYNYKAIFPTLLTKVTDLQTDSLIEISNNSNEILDLDYENNSLHFEFSVPVFPAKGKVEYRYFLDGFDKSHSEWTTATKKDYTNLPDGIYSFIVQAQNEFGMKAQEARLNFHILTPMYRRWWAILIYLAGIFMAGKMFFNWRMRATEKEKEALEEIVRERTQEIFESKKRIEEQRDIAYTQKKHILDSISYAKKIQDAVLPSPNYINEVLFDHFILFKPRDIVSGDFYWVRKVGDFVVVVAADCTGHGVPGAFMSMLGSSFLNEIVNTETVQSAGDILNELRSKVKTSLKQEGKEGEQKDGMDIALTVIDFNKLEVGFSGAYNPLYIIRKDPKDENEYELIQLKADRQPIGIYLREKPFSTQQYTLQKNDTLYTFSDGYIDQFGGETGEKLKSKRFKELLLSIQDKSMPEQKEILDRNLTKWKRDREQVDDIIIFGVRI